MSARVRWLNQRRGQPSGMHSRQRAFTAAIAVVVTDRQLVARKGRLVQRTRLSMGEQGSRQSAADLLRTFEKRTA